VGAAGQVLAIDANPAMIAAIGFNAEASGLAQLRPIHAAVGERETEVALDLSANDMGGVAVAEGAGGIPMRPLLHILADAGVSRIAALKIDIEGHEDSALVPFFAAAPAGLLPGRIVIERERQGRTRQPGSLAAFAAHGYRLRDRRAAMPCGSAGSQARSTRVSQQPGRAVWMLTKATRGSASRSRNDPSAASPFSTTPRS